MTDKIVVHIDPSARTVSRRTVDGSPEQYQALGGGFIEHAAYLDPRNDLWVHEDGRNTTKPYGYWTIGTAPDRPVFIGPAFVAGKLQRKDGEHIASTGLTVEQVSTAIHFLT